MAISLSLADLSGFIAVVLVGAAAFLMLVRGLLLKVMRNLNLLRITHITIAMLGGVFLVIHVSYFWTYPATDGVILGYAAFAVAMVVWLTGTAFLEKVRNSLLFHGSLTTVLVSLALIHGASASVTLPALFSQVMLVVATAVVVANMVYYLLRLG